MDALKRNALLSIVTYLLIYLFGSLFFQVVTTLVFAQTSGYSFSQILEAMSSGKGEENLLLVSYKTLAYSNFFTYLALFGALVVLNREYLFRELTGLKKVLLIVFGLVFGVILYSGSIIISDVLTKFNIGESENQNIIVEMIKNGGAVVTFFSVGILAPVVEEIIYRKAIGDLTLQRSRILFYVISILAFGLPHMLSTSASVGVWLLMAIPYLFSGLILALAYDRFRNIYVAIIAHMLNNIVSYFVILGVVMLLC